MPRRGLALLSLAFGALLALCLPKPGLCPLAWFALAWPLSAWSRADSKIEAAALGWCFGAAFWATGFFWIYQTCRFAQVAWPAAVFAWLAMSAVFGLCWAAFAAGARWMRRSLPAAAWPWACAALWTAEEFFCDRFLTYGGALPLEYTQWRFLPLIQPISVMGPHALGFLIVLINALLARAGESARSVEDPASRIRAAAAPVAIAGGLVLAWWGLGACMLGSRRPPAALKRVAILQPNVDQYRKWDESFAGEIRSRIGSQIRQAAKGEPDLILWPESSVPGWLDGENQRWLSTLLKQARAYQLVGVIGGTPRAPSNAAELFDPRGQSAGEYRKRQLVPFGEFVPVRPVAARFIGLLDQFGDLEAGASVQPPMSSALGRLGATICFEAVFPNWDRLNASAGAQVLVNLTNDGWYKDTWGPHQHFYVNVFRAVENRLPVLRSANTGISGVIDPYGRVLARLDLGETGVLSAQIPIDVFPAGSFYARHGDWFGWLNLAGVVILGIGAILGRKGTER